MDYFKRLYKNRILVLCLFSILGIGIYLNSFDNALHYDDDVHVVFNKNIRSLDNLSDFFTNPRTGASDPNMAGHYRPFVVTSYAINYALGELNPAGYHITNLIFHIGMSFIIFLVISEFNMPIAAVISGLIFLVHPFNSEAVNYITARSSVMSGFFYMLAFYFWIRFRKQKKIYSYFASLISYVAGMLCKEVTVTLPVMILIFEFYNIGLLTKSKSDKKFINLLHQSLLCLPYLLIVIVPYMIVRFIHFGSVVPKPQRNITIQLLTELPVLVKYWIMFFIPYPLAPVHFVKFYNTLWTLPVTISAIVLILLLILACFLYFSMKNSWRYFSFFIIWFFIVLLPTTLFPLNAILQENRGYLAVVSFSVCVGIIINEAVLKVHQKYKALILIGFVILLSVYGIMVFKQNKVWADGRSLWTHVVKNEPKAYTGYSSLGIYYYRLGELEKAKELLYKAAEVGGDGDYSVHKTLGGIYILQQKPELALLELEKAIGIYPYSPFIHSDIGYLYYKEGKSDRAEKHYKEAIRLDPEDYMPLFNLGILYDDAGKKKEAIDAYKKALSINPKHLKSHYLLGMLLENIGMKEDAESHYLQISEIGKGISNEDEKEIIVESLKRLKKLRQ